MEQAERSAPESSEVAEAVLRNLVDHWKVEEESDPERLMIWNYLAGSPRKWKTSWRSDLPSNPAQAPLAEGHIRIDVSFGDAKFVAEGPGETVLEAFAAFREQVAASSPEDAAPAEATEFSPALVEARARDLTVSTDTASVQPKDIRAEEVLPVFLKSRSLRTNSEIAAAIATWAKRHNHQDELTPEEAEQHWKRSGRKVPSNIPRDMSTAASEGWLTRLGSGRYAVTAYGERYVDDKVDV